MIVTRQLGEAYDVLAPDTSEIRLLVATNRGSLAHGTLPPGRVSLASSVLSSSQTAQKRTSRAAPASSAPITRRRLRSVISPLWAASTIQPSPSAGDR